MKTIKKNFMVPLEKIHTDFFVRKALNDDRLAYFLDLVEEITKQRKQGKEPDSDLLDKVRPIVVTPAYRVTGNGKLDYLPDTPYYEAVDGRHRKWSWEASDTQQIEVQVVEFETKVEMIAFAYGSNAKGPLPPSQDDTRHTVRLLLEVGSPQKEIADAIGLPLSIARKFIERVKSELNRAKIIDAADDVLLNRSTVPDAAAKNGVDEDDLREFLSKNKRKSKKGLEEIHKGLTSMAKGSSSRRANLFQNLLDKYQDRDVTVKQVRKVFKHLHDILKRQEKSLNDWEQRFEALVRGVKNGSSDEKRESA